MSVISPEKSVFISYRRAVSQHFARAIRLELIKRGYDVFLDVDSIGSGEFDSVILTEIRARPHFVFYGGGLSGSMCGRDGLAATRMPRGSVAWSKYRAHHRWALSE